MLDKPNPLVLLALYVLAICVLAFLAGIFFKAGWSFF